MKSYLLLPEVKIHNANAMSSTFTIGFPAMTAWLGFVHALERCIVQQERFNAVRLSRVAVICHDCDLQTYKDAQMYYSLLISTANPLRKKGASFERPPFIPEARIHLTVSLLIDVDNINGDNERNFLTEIEKDIYSMKIAGGDILSFVKPEIRYVDDEDEDDEETHYIIRKLMPGYAIIERKELLEKNLIEDGDAVDALLNVLKLRPVMQEDAEKEKSKKKFRKKYPGWLVPIAVGFKGLSKLDKISNQRDLTKEHRFAESIVTLGEFRMVHHFEDLTKIMWQYRYDKQNNMYLCENDCENNN